ncbi:MAG: diguanylate cyclase [Magnetococcales bacterium]|nr:diguanylate cyclase [Magnetococcales bacterium]
MVTCLSGNPSYRKPFDEAAALVEARLSQFKLGQPDERSEDIIAVETTINAKLAELRETLRLYETQGFDAALSLVKTDQGKVEMDRMTAIIERLISEDSVINASLHEGIAQKADATSKDWIILSFASFIGLMAAVAGMWRASKKIGELAAELEHEARHDKLTGLPNRASLMETLHYVLSLAGRENRRVVLLFLDLNGFKTINDNLGHDKGDLALVLVAKALKSILRESDFAARLGGDEFTVVISTLKDACTVCQRIETAISSISVPELLGYKLGTSIGVALFPDDGTHAEVVLATADARMFEQKRAKKAGMTLPICPICEDDPLLCPIQESRKG